MTIFRNSMKFKDPVRFARMQRLDTELKLTRSKCSYSDVTEEI